MQAATYFLLIELIIYLGYYWNYFTVVTTEQFMHL